MNNLSPEAMQAIMNTGDNDPEAELLKQRQERQSALRRQSMEPVSQGQMAGRVFLPNYAGSIKQGLAGIQANRQQGGLDQATTQTMGRANDGRQAYAQKLIEALRRPQEQQQQPEMPEQAYGAGGGRYGDY